MFFWKIVGLKICVYILLQNVTLHELMDEDDILQECKAQNRKLITL